MNIGIIGSGKIGATVGGLWAKAGHSVMFSSRHPEKLDPLVAKVGSNARRGTPEEAAKFGESLLISIPFAALPALGQELASFLVGKVALETGNPYPERDGPMAQEVRDSSRGSGVFTQQYLTGAIVVRAFNSVNDVALAAAAHRAGERIGIPLASDSEEALELAAQLVRDAGFEPVVLGPLGMSRFFDVGSPAYNKALPVQELRPLLGIG